MFWNLGSMQSHKKENPTLESEWKNVCVLPHGVGHIDSHYIEPKDQLRRKQYFLKSRQRNQCLLIK